MDDAALLKAALLGLIEGVTEFLPISSTGHLILASHLLDVPATSSKLFNVVIQTGAILAVCWVYRGRLSSVALGFASDVKARRFVLNVSLAFLPAALAGALLHGFIKATLFSPWVVPVSLIAGGIAILAVEHWCDADSAHDPDDSAQAIDSRTAFAIGLCQLVALIPGISRAGATILGAIALGVPRKAATEFSFFLAIPTMFGAASYDLYKNWQEIDGNDALAICIGTLTSFVCAIIVIKWLVGFVGHHRFTIFAWYRIVLGTAAIALLTAG